MSKQQSIVPQQTHGETMSKQLCFHRKDLVWTNSEILKGIAVVAHLSEFHRSLATQSTGALENSVVVILFRTFGKLKTPTE